MDTLGVELAGYAEAVREAKKRARDLVGREAMSGSTPARGAIIVDDEWQRFLEIPF